MSQQENKHNSRSRSRSRSKEKENVAGQQQQQKQDGNEYQGESWREQDENYQNMYPQGGYNQNYNQDNNEGSSNDNNNNNADGYYDQRDDLNNENNDDNNINSQNYEIPNFKNQSSQQSQLGQSFNNENQDFNNSNNISNSQQYQNQMPNLLQNMGNQQQGEIQIQMQGNQQVNIIPPHQQFGYRHARRLYVGNIPERISLEYITEWLYRSMEACGGLLETGNPIIKVQIDQKQKFAFIELRSIEETTSMLQLDGIILWNRSLRIRRPTEYDKFPKVIGSRAIPQLDLSLLEGIGILIIPTQVEDSPNKIFLANLLNTLDEYTILENLKLKEHGELKAFHLVKDNLTNESKGFAFFEYKDPSITDLVIKALNGCQFYQRTLTCKRAIGGDQGQNIKGGPNNRQNNNNNLGNNNNNNSNNNNRNFRNSNNQGYNSENRKFQGNYNKGGKGGYNKNNNYNNNRNQNNNNNNNNNQDQGNNNNDYQDNQDPQSQQDQQQNYNQIDY